jgi:hypothetical protein
MKEFTQEQTEIMNELASFIKLKNYKIETKEEMNFAFQQFLQNNFSCYFFKTENEQKENIIRKIKKTL